MTDDLGESQQDVDGVNLSHHEAKALALRIVAGWARHGEEPEWESLPMLGEHAFERLCEAIVALGHDMEKASREFDHATGIDSAYLMEKATDFGGPS